MRRLFYIALVTCSAGAWFFFRSPQVSAPLDISSPVGDADVLPVSVSSKTEEAKGGSETISLASAPKEDLRPPFLVTVLVRRVFAGWQRLDFAEGEVQQKGMRNALRRDVEGIKMRLYSDGFFSETALRKQMLRAAEELGYRPEEARYVVTKVLSLVKAEKDAEGQHHSRRPGMVSPAGF
jgi:hypothetical protein